MTKRTLIAGSDDCVGAVDWPLAANQLCSAVEGKISETARRAAESIYEAVLESTQDYLRDNVVFNLSSQLAALHRETESLRAVADAARLTNSELVNALKLLRSLINEGGVPRYTVTPGAALNSFVEETLDPLLARLAATKGVR